MNYLFILSDYGSANGYCVETITKYIDPERNHIHVLTVGEAGEERRGSVTVHRVNAPLFQRHRFLKPVAGIAKKLGVVLHYPVWPICSFGLAIRLGNAAKKIFQEHEIDVVVPVYNAIEAVLAGMSVKKHFPRVLLVPYFLDSMRFGQVARFMRKKVHDEKAKRMEDRILSTADRMIVMESSREAYDREGCSCREKLVFLDLPLFEPAGEQEKQEKNGDGKLFLYIGSMPNNIRDPQYCLEFLHRLKDEKYRFLFIGPSDYEEVLSLYKDKDRRFERILRVSHEEATEWMRKADYLVNIGNTLAYMTPSKIFEYISAGKPILSFYKMEKDSGKPYLDRYGLAVQLYEKDDMTENISKFSDFCKAITKNGEIKKPNYSGFDQNKPKAFVDRIEEIYHEFEQKNS